MTLDDQSTLDTWEPCPPGTLSRLRQSSPRPALGTLAVKTAVAGSLCAGLLFASWWSYVSYQNREYQFNGLTCSDVRSLIPELRRGALDPRLEELLRQHVARCPVCVPLAPQLPPVDALSVLDPGPASEHRCGAEGTACRAKLLATTGNHPSASRRHSDRDHAALVCARSAYTADAFDAGLMERGQCR